MNKILMGTTKGEMTLVAISVAPLGKVAIRGAAIRSYKAPGPGNIASTAAATPMASTALSMRSRSSIRCCTKGCSEPASSSGLSLGASLIEKSDPAQRGRLALDLGR